MNNFGKWLLTAISPLGDEEYGLDISKDGSGSISHPKGGVDFSNAVFSANGVTEICGATEIPMTETFSLKIAFSESAGVGALRIGDYVEVPLEARRP